MVDAQGRKPPVSEGWHLQWAQEKTSAADKIDRWIMLHLVSAICWVWRQLLGEVPIVEDRGPTNKA